MPIVIVPSVPSRGGSLRHASTLGNAPAHSGRGGVLLGVIGPTLRAHEFRGDGARLQEVIGWDRADAGVGGKTGETRAGAAKPAPKRANGLPTTPASETARAQARSTTTRMGKAMRMNEAIRLDSAITIPVALIRADGG